MGEQLFSDLTTVRVSFVHKVGSVMVIWRQTCSVFVLSFYIVSIFAPINPKKYDRLSGVINTELTNFRGDATGKAGALTFQNKFSCSFIISIHFLLYIQLAAMSATYLFLFCFYFVFISDCC